MKRQPLYFMVVSQQMESKMKRNKFRWTDIAPTNTNSTLEALKKLRIPHGRCLFTHISEIGMDPIRRPIEQVRRAGIIIAHARRNNLNLIAENDLIENLLHSAGGEVLVTLKSVKKQSRKTRADKLKGVSDVPS